MLALAAWEANRCPCGCGQSLTECLIDTDVPETERPQWEGGYYECSAGLHLAKMQAKQREQDETQAKSTGNPVHTSHRIWAIKPRKPEEGIE